MGEAPGENEELTGIPFIGNAGQLLQDCCSEAGIEWKDVYLTNVFWSRPPQNKLDHFLVPKAEGIQDWPALSNHKHVHPSLRPELDRLRNELETLRPNLVVALGNTACWALLKTTSISKIRGTIAESAIIPGLKVLPTYHPSYLFHNWEDRVIVIQDLRKAALECKFPEIIRPSRRLTVNPTIEEVEAFVHEALAADLLSVDTETFQKQIDLIGFSTGPSRAFVIPFYNKYSFQNYWPTLELEVRAYKAVRTILCSPVPKLFQNGLYDLQYIWRWGIPVRNCEHDLMLLHHSHFPELQKGLGFLGSVYTNEASWKLLRTRSDETEMVRSDE